MKDQMSAASFREMLNLPPTGAPEIVKRVPVKRNKSNEKKALESLLKRYAEAYGFTVKDEFLFHPVRKWRADWYIPELRLSVEFNGLALGNANISRHQTITGHSGDCEKHNQAQIMGIIVLQYTPLNHQQFAKDFQMVVAARNLAIVEKK